MKINYTNKAKFEKLLNTSISKCKKSIERSKRQLETDTPYWNEIDIWNECEEKQLEQLEVISEAFYLMFVNTEEDFEDALLHDQDPREEI
tara:strand:+ start:543 stop:812 length:270 start_codon:yes stop_codon:yes gene_type:complete